MTKTVSDELQELCDNNPMSAGTRAGLQRLIVEVRALEAQVEQWCAVAADRNRERLAAVEPSTPRGIMGTNCPYGNEDCPRCNAPNRTAEP
jgi:hypothetical protein